MSNDVILAVSKFVARPSGPTSEIYMQVFGKLLTSLPHCPFRELLLDSLYRSVENICADCETAKAHRGTVAYAKALEATIELRSHPYIAAIKSICRRQKKLMDSLGVLQAETEALCRDLTGYNPTDDSQTSNVNKMVARLLTLDDLRVSLENAVGLVRDVTEEEIDLVPKEDKALLSNKGLTTRADREIFSDFDKNPKFYALAICGEERWLVKIDAFN